jgi:hypothetical protein
VNKEQAIKWGLILAGVYLIYEYAQSHGGFKAMFGYLTSGDSPGAPLPTPTTFTAAAAKAPGVTDAQAAAITAARVAEANKTMGPSPATLDLTGLVVSKDINDSLAGTLKINGQPVRLAIIQADGRIFNNAGEDVTTSLAAQGVNVDALRSAFARAGAGLGMFAPLGARFGSAYWLM